MLVLFAFGAAPRPAQAAEIMVSVDSADLVKSPAWRACGGDPPADHAPVVSFAAYVSRIACVSKTDDDLAVTTLHAAEIAMESQYARAPERAQLWLALMKIHADHGRLQQAKLAGEIANHTQKLWDGTTLSEEEPVYWDMLPVGMQKVLALHGGTRLSNLRARPQEWKIDSGNELWVYRADAANVTTYIFSRGKLLRTLKS